MSVPHLQEIRKFILTGIQCSWPNPIVDLNPLPQDLREKLDQLMAFLESTHEDYIQGLVPRSERKLTEQTIITLLDEQSDYIRGVWVPGEPSSLIVFPINAQALVVDEIIQVIARIPDNYGKEHPWLIEEWNEYFHECKRHVKTLDAYSLTLTQQEHEMETVLCSGKHQIDPDAWDLVKKLKLPEPDTHDVPQT
jgi:hypothetical protein